MKTLQEIYNFIIPTIFEKNDQCTSQGGSCVYDNKLKDSQCLVGRCILKEHRGTEYEGSGLIQVTDWDMKHNETEYKGSLKEALFKSGIDTDDEDVYSLLENFQSFHDDYTSAGGMMLNFDEPLHFEQDIDYLKTIGIEFNLDVSIVDKCIIANTDKYSDALKETFTK